MNKKVIILISIILIFTSTFCSFQSPTPDPYPTPYSTIIPSSIPVLYSDSKITEKDGSVTFNQGAPEKTVSVKFYDYVSKEPVEGIIVQYYWGNENAGFLVIDLNGVYLPAVFVEGLQTSFNKGGIGSNKVIREPNSNILVLAYFVLKVNDYIKLGISLYDFYSDFPEIINFASGVSTYCFTGDQLANYINVLIKGVKVFPIYPPGKVENAFIGLLIKSIFFFINEGNKNDLDFIRSLPDKYEISFYSFPNQSDGASLFEKILGFDILGTCNDPDSTDKKIQQDEPQPPASTACSITSFNVSPSSPQTKGTSIHITGQAQCNNASVQSLRFLVDGGVVYEIGAPSLDTYWNTSSYSSGSHQLSLQVAAVGDNSWSNIGHQEKSFELTIPSSPPTETPYAPPNCSITSFNVSPSSPQSAGTPIHITAQGSCSNVSVRAMRILVNSSSIYEIGAPSIVTNWNTNSYGAGSYQITVQVAGVGDNNWTYAGSQSTSFTLSPPLPTDTPAPPPTCSGPTLSSPSNGALLNNPNVSFSWNTKSGATEYKFEIWGGDFGGNHQSPCGWSGSTSCNVNNLGKYNYMWRVIARIGGQECPSAQEWNVTISY
ncbi:MAG TPA: hypothetical protein DEP80_03710 [Anaerolineae bacterium]|nr:hypothetical protein [Anaerolineae bacterium]